MASAEGVHAQSLLVPINLGDVCLPIALGNRRGKQIKNMIKETPTTVMSFLAASLLSLAFLFSVTITNASFSGPEQGLSLPDPFGPQNVVHSLDAAANSYSNFLMANLFEPYARESNQFAYDVEQNSAWVLDSIDTKVVAMAGLDDLLWQEPTPMAHAAHSRAQVAGAFIVHNLAP